MLIKANITVRILGRSFENPFEYFILIAHAVSKIPAIKRINQVALFNIINHLKIIT